MPTPDPSPRSTRRWVKPLAFTAFAAAVVWIVIGQVGRVDWPEVGAALSELAFWQLLVLFAALLVRQSLNATPLALFVPGLGLARAMQNDLSANLMATVAPPPSDFVIRVAMFKSWGLDPVRGVAGMSLNTVAFYAVRFLAPALGLLLVAVSSSEQGRPLVAGLSALIALAILVGVYLVLKSEDLAAWVGRTAGRLARRFRSTVDPEDWAHSVVDFRGAMLDNGRAGFIPAMAALIGVVLCDALMIVLALRFVGVTPAELAWVDIVAAFLLAYPLTLFPFSGLGVLDASLVATWTDIGGPGVEAPAVAALIVWRVFTLLVALGLGLITLTVWRRRTRMLEWST